MHNLDKVSKGIVPKTEFVDSFRGKYMRNTVSQFQDNGRELSFYKIKLRHIFVFTQFDRQ